MKHHKSWNKEERTEREMIVVWLVVGYIGFGIFGLWAFGS